MPDPQGAVYLVLEDGQLPTDTTARAFRQMLVDAAGTSATDTAAGAVKVTNVDGAGTTVTDTTAAAIKVTMVDAAGTNITDTTYSVLTVKKYSVEVASTTDTLDTAGVYTGSAVDVSGLERIVGIAYSDQPSAASGLSVRQAVDDTNWDYTETFTVVAATALPFSVEVVGEYASVIYTNGSDTAQATMRLLATAR